MQMTYRDHDEATAEMFRRNPAQAASYLTGVLADGDEVDIMLALRSLQLAFGKSPPLALPDATTPEEIWTLASTAGNPTLGDLRAKLTEMGFQLAVTPIAPARSDECPAAY